MKYLFLSLFSLSQLFALAQASGNYMYNTSNRWSGDAALQVYGNANAFDYNHLTLDVKGLYNVPADSYMAILHVTQVGPDARAVDSLMNRRIQGFIQEIEEAGIERDDVYIDMLSLVPIFEIEKTGRLFSKTYNEVPAGFEMQKNIHLRFTDSQVLDKIITAAAFHEIYDLVKVEYFIENIEAVYDSLRSRVSALMHERVAQFDSLGIALEGQWRVAKDHKAVYQPQDRYARYQSFTNTSVEASVRKGSVTQMKKPQTMFYDKLSYSDYDLVGNPEILEPVVQFTYSLSMQLELKRPQEPRPEVKTETRHHYFLLNPEGDIKPLELHD